MKSYQDPSFQDRVGRAAEAKRKALDQLRSKPPVDEEAAAARRNAQAAKAAAEDERRAAKKAAELLAKTEKAAQKAAALAAKAVPVPTEQELKAARDARYAARKNRK